MVCLSCLVPIFLVPIVSLSPLLFDLIMARVYDLLGWEYRKPERASPASLYKPVANKSNSALQDSVRGSKKAGMEHEPNSTAEPLINSIGADHHKHD